MIRLDPWRLKAADAATLAAGGEALTWRAHYSSQEALAAALVPADG